MATETVDTHLEECSLEVADQLSRLLTQADRKSACEYLYTLVHTVLTHTHTHTPCQIFLLIEVLWPLVLYTIIVLLRLNFPPGERSISKLTANK